MKAAHLLLIFLLVSSSLRAQLVTGEDESRLYAETKQVNQFFRRFNGEEDEKGNRYYPRDKQYRSAKLRRKYLSILFDANNKGMNSALKTEFAKSVLEKEPGAVLDFHGGNWFSEVQCVFTSNGSDHTITLFLELERDHLGWKWSITKVHSELFMPYFVRDTSRVGRFIHPMSHELDFMNLRKAFAANDSIAQFASKGFVPDQLSVFLYEVKKGNLKFKSVVDEKFHFFQIDGWYFELSNFNREGYNTGWLISNLVKINSPAEKEVLTKYLYYESR